MLHVTKTQKRRGTSDESRTGYSVKNSQSEKIARKGNRTVSKKMANPLLSTGQTLFESMRAASKVKAAAPERIKKHSHAGHREGHKTTLQLHNGLKSKHSRVSKANRASSQCEVLGGRSRQSSAARSGSRSGRGSSVARTTRSSLNMRPSIALSSSSPALQHSLLNNNNNNNNNNMRRKNAPSSIPLLPDSRSFYSNMKQSNSTQDQTTEVSGFILEPSNTFVPCSLPSALSPNLEKIGVMLNKKRLPTRTVRDLQLDLARIQSSCNNGLESDTELRRMAREAGVELTGPWLVAMQRADPTLGSTRLTLNDLCAGDLISIFGYCDVPSLAELTRVCSRFYTLCGSREVWTVHTAGKKNIAEYVAPKNPKQMRMNTRVQAQKEGEAEEKGSRNWETMYKDLERRLTKRVLARSGEEDTRSVQSLLPFQRPHAMLHDYRTDENSCAGPKPNCLGSFSLVKMNSTKTMKRSENLDKDNGELLEQLCARIKEVETERDRLASGISANNERIHAQQKELDELRNHIFAAGCPSYAEDNPASALSNAYLTIEDLERFEQHMVSLVLNGRGNGPEVVSLPVVLRRGIKSFGTLELLLSKLHPSDAAQEASISGEVDERTRCDMNSWKAIQKRWSAFKAFFPLNENGYYTARRCLIQKAVADSGAEGCVTLSKRQEQALLRVKGVIRRVESMKESEVLDIVM